MMKKTVSSILLASALLLGTVAPVAANAAETDPTSTGKTDTHVTMTAPKDQTNPVDPTNPSKGTDTDGTGTTDPGNTNNNGATVSGPLTFLYVTKDMTFKPAQSVISGTQSMDVDSIQKSTFMKNGTPNENFVTEIGDSRGTNEGWSVNVSSSQMKTDAGDVLAGATVDFDGAGSNTQITNSATADGISANNVSLDTATNDPATIYSAAKGAGAGATAFQLGTDNIHLSNVKANATAGTYNGSLTWTLSNTPASSDATNN
ncbi:WxL domain-containing protein [Levilactobacillus angrenensis]|uniref:WxL domain-containing protein n=1 Tax=Levilactobacillus angrenensis TaxID=2486020 RepID=A0ABW1UAU1_9LACO|nr:WxL domain-containing protein [Levilactobacillus angrenensis]